MDIDDSKIQSSNEKKAKECRKIYDKCIKNYPSWEVGKCKYDMIKCYYEGSGIRHMTNSCEATP
jgi:hypothetical protein